MNSDDAGADETGGGPEINALSAVIDRERRRSLMSQRTVAKRSKLTQQKVSAYECGRVTPPWDAFVRILAAMDRKPVLTVEPLEPPPTPGTQSIEAELDLIQQAIGDRSYRIEGIAAAHVLGAAEVDATWIEQVSVSVEGDPGRLDTFANALSSRYRAVWTVRGGHGPSEVSFMYGTVRIALLVVPELRPWLDVVYRGRQVPVAPLEDIPHLRPQRPA
jgi:transcriptional regulator with XRE-family HTH domain